MSTYNFNIFQGTTVQTDIQLQDVTGAPLDLTGMTVKSDAKTAYSDVSASFSFSTVIPAPTSGSFSLKLTASQSSLIVAGDYVYDVHLINGASSTVSRILGGVVTVLPGVTS